MVSRINKSKISKIAKAFKVGAFWSFIAGPPALKLMGLVDITWWLALMPVFATLAISFAIGIAVTVIVLREEQ